jgi:hypothetical protein
MSLVNKIKTIWQNRKNIWYGIYYKYINRTDHSKTIAEARMKICNACPHIDHTGHQCLVPATQPCCGKCGCSLALKVFSLSSGCGDDNNPRWEAIMTEEEEDVYREIHNK